MITISNRIMDLLRVFSGTGFCVGPVARPEESIGCGASECEVENSKMSWPRLSGVVEQY
jgi:hypothetical protein